MDQVSLLRQAKSNRPKSCQHVDSVVAILPLVRVATRNQRLPNTSNTPEPEPASKKQSEEEGRGKREKGDRIDRGKVLCVCVFYLLR